MNAGSVKIIMRNLSLLFLILLASCGGETDSEDEAPEQSLCQANSQQQVQCSASIPNALYATYTRTCNSEGSAYESTHCTVSQCNNGFELNGNACEPASQVEPVSFDEAVSILQNQCINCHIGIHSAWGALNTEQAWLDATNGIGEKLIDLDNPEHSYLLKRIAFYGATASNMPLDNTNQTEPFTEAHYNTLRNWAIGLGERNNSGGNGEVTISQVQFDENGLRFLASCDSPQILDVAIENPNASQSSILSEFEEVYADNAEIFIAIDSIATQLSDGSIQLLGSGIDIWESAIHFNALRKSVNNGELDITLQIDDVSNIQHDFAKVGIMVSSSAGDISGDLLFLHWAGRSGIAEDSGSGVLNGYHQLLENPNPNGDNPTPATLRLVYSDGALLVGACFDCSNPSLQAASVDAFVPQTLFIVASSHDTTDIQANIQISDAYSSYTPPVLAQSQFSCGTTPTTVSINPEAITSLQQLRFDVLQNGSSIAQFERERIYSLTASCSIQDGLLLPKVRRLSQTQIENSIRDIFGDIFSSDIWPELGDGAKLIGMNHTSDKLNINSLNMERIYDSSRAIVSTLLSSHVDIQQCSQQSSDACVGTLMNEYGLQLWRRPLTSTETSDLNTALSTFDNNTDKLEFLFNGLLLSSNFLFRSEIGAINNDLQALNNYELISLLAYTIWNSTPDETLLNLANQSTPLSESQLRSQIDRMFNDPRTTQALVEIYKDYLKLDLVLSREKASSFGFTDSVRQQLLQSAERMLQAGIETSTNYMDPFNGSEYFVNDTISSFFNANVSSSALTLTPLNSSERYGILNHPAFLAVHSTLDQSGIVKRGVFTLEQILCEELPDPPDDVMSIPAPDDIDPATTSERELLQITHSSQSACVGCHAIIDPAGFGFENFDAVGRYRTVEKDVVPIDASGPLELGETVFNYNTSAEYSRVLSESNTMKHCVERRFLEHFLGQELHEDSCEYTKYKQLLENSNGSIKDLILALVQLESFNTRAMGR